MASFIAQVEDWPISIQAIIGAAILGTIYAFIAGQRPYEGLPVASIKQQGWKALLQAILPGFSWTFSPREVLSKGKEISRATDGIYQVRASSQYKIVLPRRFADEIRNTENLSFTESVKHDFHASQPGFEGMLEGCNSWALMTDVIHKLIQSLGVILGSVVDEVDASISNWLGDSKEWKSYQIKDIAVDTIAHVATRVLCGYDFARNEEWIHIAKDHTTSLFIASTVLHQVPAFVKPLLVYVIPICRRLRKQVASAHRLMAPRVKELEQITHDPSKKPSSPDAFTWMVEVSKGRPVNFTLMQLNISLASIHTTSEVFTRLMVQCCQTPDIVKDLREEIVRVLREEGGWSRAALYKMRLLDSFMREVTRMHRMSAASMLRYVKQNTKLSNGVVLPVGALVMVEDDGPIDPNVNSDPETFDAYRFMKLRDQPEQESRHHFHTASPDNLVFGHGNHACPGRQFAALELKVMLGIMLLRYDWRFEPGYQLGDYFWFESRVAAPEVVVQCRRREEEIDLLQIK